MIQRKKTCAAHDVILDVCPDVLPKKNMCFGSGSGSLPKPKPKPKNPKKNKYQTQAQKPKKTKYQTQIQKPKTQKFLGFENNLFTFLMIKIYLFNEFIMF
jgi:hypothetical protein